MSLRRSKRPSAWLSSDVERDNPGGVHNRTRVGPWSIAFAREPVAVVLRAGELPTGRRGEPKSGSKGWPDPDSNRDLVRERE